jgi:nitronate monooxygenase
MDSLHGSRSSAILKSMQRISTAFSQMMKIDVPIIGAPMFLVSNEDLVVEVSEFGGIGTFPALNYRPLEKYEQALRDIRARTKKPIGVNVIVNKSNRRQEQDLKLALDHGVELFITSLGNPREVIREAHKQGAKVLCDVVDLQTAKKVADLGADGVIAVASGAGGHAGGLSPFALIPWLKRELKIPVIAAGAIADGASMAAALVLGADGVSIGTRFIASHEAGVDLAYKQAVVRATPADIVMTSRISGTPAAVINTPYVQKLGTELPWILRVLKSYPLTKKWTVPLIHYMGMGLLADSAHKPSWKTVWSAGQSVGAVNEILSVREILTQIINEYGEAGDRLKRIS